MAKPSLPQFEKVIPGPVAVPVVAGVEPAAKPVVVVREELEERPEEEKKNGQMTRMKPVEEKTKPTMSAITKEDEEWSWICQARLCPLA